MPSRKGKFTRVVIKTSIRNIFYSNNNTEHISLIAEYNIESIRLLNNECNHRWGRGNTFALLCRETLYRHLCKTFMLKDLRATFLLHLNRQNKVSS